MCAPKAGIGDGIINKLKEGKIMREFELTEQHLALMKRMWVAWQDCEFGAPEIDPKRPYGNSGILDDIAEILGVPIPDEDKEFPPEVIDRLEQLHLETQFAIAIMLQCGKVQIGKYKADDYDNTTWKKA